MASASLCVKLVFLEPSPASRVIGAVRIGALSDVLSSVSEMNLETGTWIKMEYSEVEAVARVPIGILIALKRWLTSTTLVVGLGAAE
jgi:hypothetical protein